MCLLAPSVLTAPRFPVNAANHMAYNKSCKCLTTNHRWYNVQPLFTEVAYLKIRQLIVCVQRFTPTYFLAQKQIKRQYFVVSFTKTILQIVANG